MTTATPAIAINDSRKPELAITYGFFNISIIADNDTAERISYLLPSTCAFTAHTNITIARVADTELPVITPNNTTNIPLIIADIGQRKPILRNSLYSPMPISDMWSPDMARICPIPAAEKARLQSNPCPTCRLLPSPHTPLRPLPCSIYDTQPSRRSSGCQAGKQSGFSLLPPK